MITAANGDQGIAATAREAPDIVILDLGLPDVNGLEVCRRIRQWSDVPIVVLSAIDSEERKIAALDGGANDYVTKPFSMGELEARIRAALRRGRDQSREKQPTEIVVGTLELDLVHRQAMLGGRPLELTVREFEVLAYLARHARKTCTHEMILAAVWGPGYGRESQYLHAYIHRLRQKLDDPNGELIKTAPGIGYVLTGDERRPTPTSS